MTTILKGDTSKAITIALSDGFNYSGKTVVVEYQGVRRSFSNAVAGGDITFSFAAEETAPMSLGTYPVRVWIEGGGEVVTVHNADVKLCVTDCIADVHSGGAIYLDVHGGLYGIEGLPERYTDEDVRRKINEIVRRGGGVVAALLLCATAAFGASVEVQTAPKGTIYNNQPVVTNVTVDVSDKADKTNTYTKAETDAKIVELAPAPGNYNVVSNAAMNAVQQESQNWLDAESKMGAIAATGDEFIPWCFMGSAYFADELVWPGDGYNYHLVYDESAMRWITWYAPPGYKDMMDEETGRFLTQEDIAYLSDMALAADAATNYTDWAITQIAPPIPVFDVYAADVTNVADFVTSNAISTNNPDFVSAVLAAPLTGASASDLAEIGEYGSYGTVGAAILALIAGLAALKRGKADKTELPYDIVAVTPSNGVVTVGPRTISTYTAGDSAIAFTVAVGTGETGKVRDCELVIDCTATGAVAPTVTWPATFHPRTDVATDFACETGKRNVYFISEYASGEFAVGGWQETSGGNA